MSVKLRMLQERPPNWLPPPGSDRLSRAQVEVDDLFSKGCITRFYPKLGLGWVERDGDGEVSVSLADARLVGPKGSERYLVAGARVGFDLSWTSSGPRITCLKVY